ncbi:ribosome biogenesis protein tsr1 [Tilletia horrida]|uniref:Ribosome biogenesis protein tsr1 n=1 Tax=Tilletia horrida TaxID=155126 RepID=A0AAN6GL69_9BASI|nr:ribosome biogenesis protein tsr1 [Tilletia horrida]KAK0549490.1 ribosome biogenesis protein tsr1 [Tilletia horrida]KAK0561754.1 ribosome biogenesis protein tsr1 [Tilletia horrida]
MPRSHAGGGGDGAGHHHRSSLKQSNKKFKSKHASKNTQRTAAKGRTPAQAARLAQHKANPFSSGAGGGGAPGSSGASSVGGSKFNRRNQAKQIQAAKRAALVQSTRIFEPKPPTTGGIGLGKGLSSSSSASAGAPRIVAVVDLAGPSEIGQPSSTDAWQAVRALSQDGEADGIHAVPGRSVDDAQSGGQPFVELEALRFRQTLQFLPLPYGALYPTLDACKCADFVLFILSASTSIEPGSWGEVALRILQAQGLPNVLVAVPSLLPDAEPSSGSKKTGAALRASNEVRKSLLSFARYFSPDVDKIHALDDHAERSALLRTLASSTPKRVAWRDFRSWVINEEAEWVPHATDGESHIGEDAKGTLKLSGWVRGAPLSANRLVHLPDFGDFAVDKITLAPLSAPRKSKPRPALIKAVNTGSRPASRAEGGTGGDVEMDTNDGASSVGGTQAQEAGDVLEERESEFGDELISENEPDEMDQEQTWPTEAELASAPAANGVHGGESAIPPAAPGTTPHSISKNGEGKQLEGPARMGKKYQAAWIMESDGEDDDDDEDDEDESDEDDEEGEGKGPAAQDLAQYLAAKSAIGNGATMEDDLDDDFGEDEEVDDAEFDNAALEAYKAERKKRYDEEADDAAFPDEVDTPLEIPARVRFARYRGMENFRTSAWDPYEELPIDYAKIFQFDNFQRTRRRVEASALEEGVQPGTRVCVWIRDVPQQAAVRAKASGVDASAIKIVQTAGSGAPATLPEREDVPFVLFGLLRHEHKKSVLNFTITRNTEYDGVVRSKDPLVLCLGPRRYRVNPIFSQHTLGTSSKSSNNVHKFERFLHPHNSGPGTASVGTVFAPITFGGASVPALLLRERASEGVRGHNDAGIGARQMPAFVGSGSLIEADPTRINAKRIILTGHPFKIHKRTATIRFMFFNPEDVAYYKPVTLHTKYGRTGHIRESIGTHGLYKAHFDGPMTQMDTVCLSLYKRVYPKWSELFKDSRNEMPLLEEVAEEEADAMEVA